MVLGGGLARGSDLRDRHLDQVVRIRSGLTEGAVLVRTDRIYRRAAAIEARPITDIGHHQPRHEIVAQLRQSFERAAVVEDAHHGAVPDVALPCVGRVDQDLLFALPAALAFLVAVLRVQERMRLGRHDAERIALGEIRVGAGRFVGRDVIRQRIDRLARLHSLVH